MNRRLQNLIDKGMIPNKGGVFIDSYNQSVNEEISGTITTRIDASNMSYVTEPKIIERDTPMKGNYTEPDDMIDRLKKMIDKDLIPLKDGLYIDCYNGRVIEGTAGTITARVND
jgi:hypothetical protein